MTGYHSSPHANPRAPCFQIFESVCQRLRTFTVGALILPLANFVGMRGAKPKQTLVCDLVRPDFLDLDRRPLYVS